MARGDPLANMSRHDEPDLSKGVYENYNASTALKMLINFKASVT